MSPKCFTCGGRGTKTCNYCKGTGTLVKKGTGGNGKKEEEKNPCPHCGASGDIRCHVCGGSGRT